MWAARSLIPTVVTLVILTTVIAAVVLAPQLVPRRIALDNVPDRPLAFGSEMSWLAVKTEDANLLASVAGPLRTSSGKLEFGPRRDLRFSTLRRFRFCFATHQRMDDRSWRFAAAAGRGPSSTRCRRCCSTCPLFSSVQYFATFRSSISTPGRGGRGRAGRAFAIGDAGIVWDAGELTPDERKLGLSFIELRGIRAPRRHRRRRSISIRPSSTS